MDELIPTAKYISTSKSISLGKNVSTGGGWCHNKAWNRNSVQVQQTNVPACSSEHSTTKSTSPFDIIHNIPVSTKHTSLLCQPYNCMFTLNRSVFFTQMEPLLSLYIFIYNLYGKPIWFWRYCPFSQVNVRLWDLESENVC